jgi:hypothetical protein
VLHGCVWLVLNGRLGSPYVLWPVGRDWYCVTGWEWFVLCGCQGVPCAVRLVGDGLCCVPALVLCQSGFEENDQTLYLYIFYINDYS